MSMYQNVDSIQIKRIQRFDNFGILMIFFWFLFLFKNLHNFLKFFLFTDPFTAQPTSIWPWVPSLKSCTKMGISCSCTSHSRAKISSATAWPSTFWRLHCSAWEALPFPSRSLRWIVSSTFYFQCCEFFDCFEKNFHFFFIFSCFFIKKFINWLSYILV